MSTKLRERIDERISDPIWWNDVLQLLKTVLAAVTAWVLAASVLDLPQPFLAPWSALLVVHATVYRTFSKGTQQVAAHGGRGAAGHRRRRVFGLTTGAITVLLVVALAARAPSRGSAPRPPPSPPPALVVLTTGFESDDSMLISRLLDTAIGVAVGLLVNVIVWPPLRRRTAAKALDRIDDRIGELLVDMAGGLGDGCQDEDVAGWIDRSPRPRRRARPGVGAGAPGAGERPDEPAPLGARR